MGFLKNQKIRWEQAKVSMVVEELIEAYEEETGFSFAEGFSNIDVCRLLTETAWRESPDFFEGSRFNVKPNTTLAALTVIFKNVSLVKDSEKSYALLDLGISIAPSIIEAIPDKERNETDKMAIYEAQLWITQSE